ncbi:MAG TPA: hypothetical protein VEI94_14095 [Candidatus Bathyarchaeia archaeon]|nr:hypothetical protein [Candidatus Bathyarchaeia archaeon]
MSDEEPAAGSPGSARLVRAVALVLVVAALAAAARGLVRHNNWYLASDQFAFLTFAGDLQHGRVFHDPTTFRWLAASGVRPEESADALYQTYIWREGALYSRYPPGFPMLLALVGLAGGETAQHWLNPALYLVLLAFLAWMSWALVRDADRPLAAGAAAAVPWLLLLLPTSLHLWGLTVARDLPAHLLALGAVVAAVAGRPWLVGLALGAACAVRPDAALYGASIAMVYLVVRPRLRELRSAALGFLVGAAPLFAYNALTQGNPFSFTQGSEFRRLLSSVHPGRAAMVVAFVHVPVFSGGGFRLSFLARTLPEHIAYIGHAFGLFSLVAAIGVVWAIVRRPVMAAALVPYPLAAMLFFSFWGHSDPRYLAGVFLCEMPLVALGAALICRSLADPGRSALGRALGAAVVWAVVLLSAHLWPREAGDPMVALELALAGSTTAAVLLGVVDDRTQARGALGALVPAVVLAGLGGFRIATSSAAGEAFQKPQIERAREAIESLVPPGSLIITRETLGRPAENITHYTHAESHYPQELLAIRSGTGGALVKYTLAGRRVFFLIAADDRETLRPLDPLAVVHRVARREGLALQDWFIDPRRAPAGAVLYEAELNDEWKKALRAGNLTLEGTFEPLWPPPSLRGRSSASSTPRP